MVRIALVSTLIAVGAVGYILYQSTLRKVNYTVLFTRPVYELGVFVEKKNSDGSLLASLPLDGSRQRRVTATDTRTPPLFRIGIEPQTELVWDSVNPFDYEKKAGQKPVVKDPTLADIAVGSFITVRTQSDLRYLTQPQFTAKSVELPGIWLTQYATVQSVEKDALVVRLNPTNIFDATPAAQVRIGVTEKTKFIDYASSSPAAGLITRERESRLSDIKTDDYVYLYLSPEKIEGLPQAVRVERNVRE